MFSSIPDKLKNKEDQGQSSAILSSKIFKMSISKLHESVTPVRLTPYLMPQLFNLFALFSHQNINN